MLWILLLTAIFGVPKIANRFTPQVKEIYINRVVAKEVIKEKIVYKPLENNIFKIERIQEPPNEAYKVEFLREFPGGCMIFGGHNAGRDFYLSVSDTKGYNHQHPIPELRKEDTKEEPKKQDAWDYPFIGQSINTVTGPTVGWINRRD